jgi:hypothetical protein
VMSMPQAMAYALRPDAEGIHVGEKWVT